MKNSSSGSADTYTPSVPYPASRADRDQDGLDDNTDLCPDVAEDMDQFNDADGCPDPDNDEDGILDEVDQCPNEAEAVNGLDDSDGCPDQSLDELRGIMGAVRGIRFKSGSAVLLPSSLRVLKKVLKALNKYPMLELRVEGHTDSRGGRTANVELSQNRARAVKKWLEKKGIAAGRIASRGLGPDMPVASNKTRKGRALNRRVELSYSIKETEP